MMTFIEIVYFCAYICIFASQNIVEIYEVYRLIMILILLLGMTYFLFISTCRQKKNPNELLSYLVLAFILNTFFLYRLILDLVNHKIHSNFTVFFKISALVLVVTILIVNTVTIQPLRDSIFEDIFWEIGANPF